MVSKRDMDSQLSQISMDGSEMRSIYHGLVSNGFDVVEKYISAKKMTLEHNEIEIFRMEFYETKK